jgi:hypothetical protein
MQVGMIDRLLADTVLSVHLLFIVFVMTGGFIALRFPWIMAVHIPAVCWGVFVELSGHTCPLTAIENGFRQVAGDAGYDGSFIEHYLVPLIYPIGLTRNIQFILASIVIITNATAYGYQLFRYRYRT